MKTLVLSMISIAATVAAMTACTSESDGIDDLTKDAPVEIKAKAGVLTIESKSTGPISGIDVEIDNVAFVKQEAAEDATITWSTTTPTSAKITNGGNIEFTPTLYYPANEATFAHLVGYHPLQNGTTITSEGKVPFNITGNEDIMYAPVQKGNKATAKLTGDAALLAPKFEHKLSQLIIKIKGDDAAATAWGKITSISIVNVQKELELDLNNGKLSAKNETKTNLPLTLNASYTYGEIPAEATPVGYSMVLPQNSAHKVIITTDNYENKEVDITIPASADNSRPQDATLAGESYTITLTFSASNISAKATVDPWKPVENGAGSVE